jgi:hypothetical protein
VKVRSGFVSNSSSSSFIILGFSLKDITLSQREILDKIVSKDKVDEAISERIEEWKFSEEEALGDVFYDFIYEARNRKNLPIDYLEEEQIIGHVLARSDDQGALLKDDSLSLMDIVVKAEQVRDLLGIPDDIEWKLFFGTNRC